MNNRLVSFLVVAVLLSCSQPSVKEKASPDQAPAAPEAPVSPEGPPPPPPPPAPLVKSFQTKSGKTILVTEFHPEGMSLSTVDVRFKDDTTASMVFTDIDPVSDIMQADLDGNGFDEVYIVSTAAGSGSYGHVYGMASNRDKSLTPVYMAKVEEADMKKGATFEGYEGHDTFRIEGGTLVRQFPVKTDGKTRTVTYKLKAGEAGWQLVMR